MAARLNLRHQEMVREKIRASQLVNRLEDHVFGDVDMSSTQVQAALGLLKKCVPDLTSAQIDAEVRASLTQTLESLPIASVPGTDQAVG